LFGNDNIHNEAHYVANNIPIFLVAEFISSVDIHQPLSDAGTVYFLDREEARARKQKYKVFFLQIYQASVCINQKCSMRIGSLHIR